MPAYADRQRNARLASNARADAKRVCLDDLDCYYDDCAYFEPLTDMDDYPDSDDEYDYDETYYGECSYEGYGTQYKQLVEPVWPPTDDVKDYLDDLWSFEDARRQALEFKAATKTALKALPKDVIDKIAAAVFQELDAEVAAKAESVRSALEATKYVWVTPRVERWYNPAADLSDDDLPDDDFRWDRGYSDDDEY
jgi:hypothetical protein